MAENNHISFGINFTFSIKELITNNEERIMQLEQQQSALTIIVDLLIY